jgi:50S ribosomal subunit-associated GTPase HflX
LEELSYADLILLMIDTNESNDSIEIKYHSCRDTLDQLNINPAKVLVILNKIDLVPKDQLDEKLAMFRELPYMSISSKTGEGTKKLRIRIAERVFEDDTIAEADVEQADSNSIHSSKPINTKTA